MNEKEKRSYCKLAPCDKDGWVQADKSKPPEFDLVQIEDDKGKRQMGWWNHYEWDYGHKRIESVIRWRSVKYMTNRKEAGVGSPVFQ